MKRSGIIITIILLLLLGTIGVIGYKSHQKRTAEAAENDRIAAERQATLDREAEARRKTDAQAEAARLSTLQAKKDAEEASARLKADAEAQAARLAALENNRRQEAARLAAEEQRLAAEKARLDAETRALAEQREREATDAAKARTDALAKIQAANQLAQTQTQQNDETEARNAARLTALKAQEKLDLQLAETAQLHLVKRIVYPPEYKGRLHYNFEVLMENSRREAVALQAQTELQQGEARERTLKTEIQQGH